MKQHRVWLGLALIVLLLGGFLFLVTGHWSLVTRQSSQRATYYCPMHPSYTSDRPGDCPICNMKLVKREPEPGFRGQQSDVRSQTNTPADICYLHTCPKVHQGQPCPMLVVAKAGEKITCPICGTHIAEGASASKKILYWTDPMIPGYKSDKPGKSPMGMDLVPVYEEEAGPTTGSAAPTGYAPILVTPQKQQLIGVKTAPVSRMPLTKTIRTVGTIARDPELYQAQAEYLQAIRGAEQAAQSATPAFVEQAKQLADSARLHLQHLGLSDTLIKEIATWHEPDRRLLSPRPGEPVWVYAKVYEYELLLVRAGQGAVVSVSSFPGQTFPAVIHAIDTIVDPMTRTTRIRAQADDPQGQLKPEMYVDVAIAVSLGEVLAIPEEAVVPTGAKQIVFVTKGEGLFEPRDVVVGAKADGFYELKTGVADGETVVTSGNFLIDSESRLKAALEGMSSPAQQDGSGSHQHGSP